MPLYNLKFYHEIERQTISLTMYRVIDSDGVPHNFITNTRGINDKPVLVVDYVSNVRYPGSMLVEVSQLENLVRAWHSYNLTTDNIDVFSLLIKLLAASQKQNELGKNKFIDEIQNI